MNRMRFFAYFCVTCALVPAILDVIMARRQEMNLIFSLIALGIGLNVVEQRLSDFQKQLHELSTRREKESCL